MRIIAKFLTTFPLKKFKRPKKLIFKTFLAFLALVKILLEIHVSSEFYGFYG